LALSSIGGDEHKNCSYEALGQKKISIEFLHLQGMTSFIVFFFFEACQFRAFKKVVIAFLFLVVE